MIIQRKYGVSTTIIFPMVKRGVVDLAVTGDWTPATGDTKISKDEGAVANTTNNPAIASGIGWKLVLTATEMQAARISIQIVDSATKAVEDQYLLIETYGHASGQSPVDYDDAVRLGLTALPNAAAEAAGGLYTRGTGAGQINQPANGMVDSNVVRNAGTAITAAAGIQEVKVASVATGAINAAALAADAITDAKVASDVTIASVTGSVGSVTSGVTVTTNNDKTGYGLSSAAVQAIWDALTSALTTVGSIGKWILDNLDVVVSTRLASASYTAPLDAAGVRSAVGLASANLDTQIGDLPTNTELATSQAAADDATLAAIAALPNASAIADAVWDEDIVAAHTTADTAGKKLSQALILYEGS